MTTHAERPEHHVTCNVCGKTMKLQRRVAAPAVGQGFEYQYWECVCGNVKVISGLAPEGPKGGRV